MMYSLWKTSACLLMLGLVSAMDLTISSNYTLNDTTCTKAVYYKSTSDEAGSCHLCFCQDRIETCWLKENSQCGGQVGRDLSQSRSRVRRSPIGLSDIFFLGATKNFFNKQLPETCTPSEPSFSEGCPPADWCVGCTVCDCDANGRWDCHILSFCNENERKKKLKGRKVPLPVRPTRRIYQNKPKPNTKISPKPKRVVKSKPKPKGKNKKQNKNARKQYNNKKVINNVKKPRINNKKPDNRAKKPNKNSKPTYKKISQIRKPKQPFKKRITTRKPQRKVYRIKKLQQKTTSIKQQTTVIPPSNKIKKKIVNFTTVTPTKQSEVSNLMSSKNNLEKYLLRGKIVKRVMTTVQKMFEKLHNTTREQQRMIDESKKDCPKKKKNNKNKPKLKDYMKKKLHDYNFRKKREALDLDLSIIDLTKENPGVEDLSVKRNIKNITEFSAPDSNTSKTNLSENSTKNNAADNSTTERSYTTDKLVLLSSSTANIIHYNYSVSKNSSNASITTESSPSIGDINNTEIILNAMAIKKAKNITGRNIKEARQYAIIMSDPKFNDLKYKKWDTSEILRDSVIKINSVLKFNKTNRRSKDSSRDQSLIKRLKHLARRKKINRKLGVAHKYNLKKIIMNNFKTAPTNYFGSNLSTTNTSHNITNVQSLLQNLIQELNNNSTTPAKLNNKESIFKYLRSIFKNIFSRKKGHNFKSHKTNEGMTLQILCGNVRACFLNKHNRIALRSKIHDLNAETEKIFKTIKIIKGLLHLIKMPDNKNNTVKKFLNSDMQKLDTILRDTYEGNSSLSETQAASISYVKENVHQFIGSVGKFATLLNEILDVLYKNNKKYSCQRNLRLSHKKKKLNLLSKIKNLLIKYNIMQNTFMKNMYRLLTNVEKNITTEYQKPKVRVNNLNNTQVIDKYSKNIIENLRRLKNLAQTLNSNRKKRQTMRDDDAIEYLLELMEYLLKKNHPLNTAPVNDGIDLLIEAIQNAPDIKTIQNKVLDEFPTTPTVTQTTSVDLSYFQEDSVSDYNRISKEENNSSKNENNLAIEQVVDNEEEITQNVYYKRFDDDNNTTVYSEYDATTEIVVKSTIKNKETEKTGFDRFESNLDNTRRYQVIYSDIEEEPIIPIISTTVPSVSTAVTKVTVAKKVYEDSTFVPLRDFKLDDDPVPDNKTRLDWIEENFGQEIREYTEHNDPNTTVILTDTTQTTSIKPPDQSVDNISSITVEQEEEVKKKRSKIAADEVLYQKQMQFLNSLDYGIEKSEVDDSDLKDDEKYSGDGFPTYFAR